MKTGLRRSGNDATVLSAPRESFAPELGWQGRAPAPAGALYRGQKAAQAEAEAAAAAAAAESEDDRALQPVRWRALRWSRLLRSTGGRIVVAGLLVVVLGSATALAVVARRFGLQNPAFVLTTSDNIQIEGNHHLSREQVLQVFAEDLERSLFRMPLADRQAQLERLPWVEHATVMRLLPNHVRVALVERTPVAFLRQGTQIGLVDAHGTLMDIPANAAGDPKDSFPVVTGVTAAQTPEVRAAHMAAYMSFMAALAHSGHAATNSISEVDLSNPEDLQAVITGPGGDVLVHFGESQYLQRYQEFEAHLPGWRQQFPRLASADMRYPGQVVLDMQRGSGPAPAVAAAPAAAPASASAPAPAQGSTLIASTAAPATAAPLAAALPRDRAAAHATATPAPKTASRPALKLVSKTTPRDTPRPTTRHPAKAAPRGHVVSPADRQRAANEKIFAELAAAHRANLRQQALARKEADRP